MRGLFRCAAVAALLLVAANAGFSQETSPPPFDWLAAPPPEHGLSPESLEALRAGLAANGTKALLVVRNDRIVLEWYAEGHSATKPHYTASMAKALVGGVSVAIAMSDGRMKLDDPASKFIRPWQDDPRKREITIAQLGSHASGLADAHEDGVPHERLSGWMGQFWRREPPPGDPFTISRDQAPLIADPGERFQYSNPGIAMLAYAATAAIKDSPHQDLRTLLRERAMRPIGAPDKEWSIGYGQTTTVDGLPLVAAWGGGGYTARTTARVGRLMLRQGD
jgi:CubicO group peptidase (beta-lactamase class C family)